MTVPFAMTMISSVGPSIGYDHGSRSASATPATSRSRARLVRLDVSLVRRGPTAEVAEAEQRAAMSRQ